MSCCDATLASRDTWDAVVVGAGVTGCTLACLLARAGRRTLLVDGAAFPRDKVCGCCRVLAVGDACGYVEPFTGEGMKWGIASAAAVAMLLPGDDLWEEDLPQRWRRVHDEILGRPMRLCRVLTWALRWPQTLAMGLGAIRILPALARRLSDAVNALLTIPVAPAT